MNKLRFVVRLAVIATFLCAFAAVAQAQATRTWVSGVGDDANPCSRTAPCKTFAGAISKTATGGEINCLDPGGFGGLTITKSITVKCEGLLAGVLVSGTNAFVINAPAGSIVTISGLDFEGLGTGLNGIHLLGAGISLHIHKCQIRNFRGANGSGINIVPSSGTSNVFIADSYIHNNGSTTTTAGIQIKPSLGAIVNISINRTQLENNFNGILASNTNGGGKIQMDVRDSLVATGTNSGIVASSNGPAIVALVDRTTVAYFTNTGIASNGANTTVRIGNSTVSNNTTGVVVLGGSTMQSFKNNQIAGNGTDGTPIPAFPGPLGTILQ